MANNNAPFYRQKIFWLLMAGPILVVIATFFTIAVALDHPAELVSDDYYKDGKHINLQLQRDHAAQERNIQAQILINPEGNAVKAFVSGKFNHKEPIRLLFLHPAKKEYDKSLTLNPINTEAEPAEYNGVFETLPKSNHWYVRLEDTHNTWRVENKWESKDGLAVVLSPKNP